MSVLDTLRERRNAVYTQARANADKAAAENRALTTAEQNEHERLLADLDALDARIAQLAAEHSRADRAEQALASLRGTPTGNRPGSESGQWLAAQLRALVGSGTTGGGAATPPDTPNMFFDRLAAASVGLRSGFRVLMTERDQVIVPRLTGDVGAAWTDEATAITQTSLTADQITAVPRKLAGIERASNEALNDSTPELLGIIETSLIRSMSLRLDLGFFEGSGTPPEITGLKNTSGISTVSMGANGAALTDLDPFADALGVLEENNATGTAIVMHPRTWKAATKLKEQTSGNNKPLLQESAGSGSQGVQRTIYGTPVFLSSQLSIAETQGTAADASSAYVYQADQVVAVLRQQTRVERDSSRLFNSDESEIRAIMRADLAVPNPAAVVRILGIIP